MSWRSGPPPKEYSDIGICQAGLRPRPKADFERCRSSRLAVRAESGTDAVERVALLRRDSLRRLRYGFGNLRHELPVGGEILGRLRLQHLDSLLERADRAPLDLLGRRGRPERLVVPRSQVADEDAVAVLVCVPQMVSERIRLFEAVEETAVGERHEHARAGDPLLHRLPLLITEVSSGGHTGSMAEMSFRRSASLEGVGIRDSREAA